MRLFHDSQRLCVHVCRHVALYFCGDTNARIKSIDTVVLKRWHQRKVLWLAYQHSHRSHRVAVPHFLGSLFKIVLALGHLAYTDFIETASVPICRVTSALCSIMGVSLFLITLECTVTFAFNLYVLELNPAISMKAVVAILSIVIAVSFTFAHFYLSEWLTSNLLSVAGSFYDSSWYRVLPMKQQKLLMLPSRRSRSFASAR